MSGIKYYQLTKGEEMPDEFCVVRDVDGEPSEYTFYVPEAENAELRELCKDMMAFVEDDDACEHCRHDAECVEAADGELVLPYESRCLMLGLFADRMRELSVEVDW